MRLSPLMLAILLATVLLLAAGAVADTGDGSDPTDDHHHMDGDDHMLLFGPWPFFGMGFVVYWFLSLPIAFLVYIDAEERRLNGLAWLVAIVIPWVGLLFVPLYMVARNGHPRFARRDPRADGSGRRERAWTSDEM